jgi:hypothetical protein
MPAKVDDLKNMAKQNKDHVDTVDAEKEEQSGNQVKGF